MCLENTGPGLQSFLGSLRLLCGLQSTSELQENCTGIDSSLCCIFFSNMNILVSHFSLEIILPFGNKKASTCLFLVDQEIWVKVHFIYLFCSKEI